MPPASAQSRAGTSIPRGRRPTRDPTVVVRYSFRENPVLAAAAQPIGVLTGPGVNMHQRVSTGLPFTRWGEVNDPGLCDAHHMVETGDSAATHAAATDIQRPFLHGHRVASMGHRSMNWSSCPSFRVAPY
jgi:hypothetical protein